MPPVLFNLYTSELFGILDKCGAGARIDELYYGLFVYADDLGLLSNTLEALQRMLETTEAYAKVHNIEFSTNEIIEKYKTKAVHSKVHQLLLQPHTYQIYQRVPRYKN